MQINKPEIIFTFPAVMGGVASFNFNIINNSSLLKHFYSKVILMHEVSDKRPLFTEQFNTDEQIVFEYSDKENQYHLQKRLNVLLGNNNGAIVTDNGLTMEAANRFRNPKTIFSLIHDYYYVNQQIKLGDLADVAIAHSSFFSDAVFAASPKVFANRVFYIPYGVKQFANFPQKKEGPLNLVFLGRLEEEKGVLKLFDIEKGLQQLGILVNWTIIGKGILKQQLLKQWEGRVISFFEPETSEEVYELLKKQDMFIFPTVFEGTPVSILESLSAGVVPITHDLPGGIRDIVTDEIGYRCKIGGVSDFIEKIRTLHNDRSLLKNMQQNCFALAHGAYDVKLNADKYFDLFLKYGEMRRKQKNEPRNLVKLDSPIFSNTISIFIRSLK
jgi:glycosyltransferase involved in cell wall biosynthesis